MASGCGETEEDPHCRRRNPRQARGPPRGEERDSLQRAVLTAANEWTPGARHVAIDEIVLFCGTTSAAGAYAKRVQSGGAKPAMSTSERAPTARPESLCAGCR